MTEGICRGTTSDASINYALAWRAEGNEAQNESVVSLSLDLITDGTRAGQLTYRVQAGNMTLGGSTVLRAVAEPQRALNVPVLAVLHEIDGTARLAFSLTGTLDGAPLSLSLSFALPTLSRASELLSVTGGVAGETSHLSFLPLERDFSHRLQLCCGEYRYEEAIPTVATGECIHAFTIPLAVATAIPTARRGTASVTLVTLLDGRVLGERSLDVRITLPDVAALRPTVTLSPTPAAALSAPLDALLLQGVTPLRAGVSVTGAFGATASCRVSCCGREYDADALIDAPSDAGRITLTATATDSRGFTGEASVTLDVLPYESPRLLAAQGRAAPLALRAENGVPAERGRGLYLSVLPTVTALSVDGADANPPALRARLRPFGASSFGEWMMLDATAFPCEVAGVSLEPNVSYTLELELSDAVGERTSLTLRVPTADVTFHLREGGGGAAFGKYAESENVLELAPDWCLHAPGGVREDATLSLRTTRSAVTLTASLLGRERVRLCFEGSVPFAGERVLLAEGVLDAAHLPTRTERALCVCEGGVIALLELSETGELALTHTVGSVPSAPLTLCGVIEYHINRATRTGKE